jgi:hypothetical protein
MMMYEIRLLTLGMEDIRFIRLPVIPRENEFITVNMIDRYKVERVEYVIDENYVEYEIQLYVQILEEGNT